MDHSYNLDINLHINKMYTSRLLVSINDIQASTIILFSKDETARLVEPHFRKHENTLTHL